MMKKTTTALVVGALLVATVGLASAPATGGLPASAATAIYTREFELAAADVDGRRMLLDLGGVRDLAAVTVNGTRLPTALWSPYVVDVTDAIRAGLNTIEVEVTNTLANERNRNLPSGLLGPVHLRPQALVDVHLKEIR